jgi:xylulokinase
VTLVAGVDSSTQSCKVLVCDAATGEVVRRGQAAHPDGTEVDPEAWWVALRAAVDQAGGLDDIAAVAVGGQQHGMVCLDEQGDVVRPALLWNDTRSAGAAQDLIEELGGGDSGRRAWAEAVGVVPVASFTVTKLRWLAEHEPASAARTAAVCLPHDYLTWRLAGAPGLDALVTDRGDASGTGYWSAAAGQYRTDFFELGLGRQAAVPRVLGPSEQGGETTNGAVLGPGTGDNAAAALGLGATSGDVVISIGTSGVACAVAEEPVRDVSGTVAGFADATGRFLPLVATLNAARVLDAAARILGVDLDELARLALAAPAGADGLVVVPYLEGERTPDRPDATGAVHGLRLATATPAHLARAAVEGMLCGLADAVDAVRALGTPVERLLLVGGAARSPAVRDVASAVLGLPVSVPPSEEYVARGAARQAAWVLSGLAEPPVWALSDVASAEVEPTPSVRARYAEVRDLTATRPRKEIDEQHTS